MSHVTSTLTIVATALVAVACATTIETSSRARPTSVASPRQLEDAAASQEELVDWWLAALAANDEQRLHGLRLTREEYMAILVPWTVKPGEPPRQVSEQPREFFWGMLDTKSRDLGRAMLQRYGGKQFRRERIEFSQPPREYAAYRAHGLVRVDVVDAEGTKATVEGPWIAEVDGRYKFIGLDWTD